MTSVYGWQKNVKILKCLFFPALAIDGPLKIYPVSSLMNSPKVDDPRCIEPVRIDRDMFERQWWGDG
jgi:hypothetical protein